MFHTLIRGCHPIHARPLVLLTILAVYTAFVHTADCLATHGLYFGIDWRVFQWRIAPGFDAYKFVAWFVLPASVAVWKLDPHYFTFARWKRPDAAILLGMCLLGATALSAILLSPDLRSTYPSLSGMPAAAKWEYAQHALIWTASWLIGWEFLHRYAWVRIILQCFPNRPYIAACLIIPAIESAYHVGQGKPTLEILFVAVGGVALTYYAVLRRNTLLPFLVHAAVEVALIAFQVLV